MVLKMFGGSALLLQLFVLRYISLPTGAIDSTTAGTNSTITTIANTTTVTSTSPATTTGKL